MNNSYTAHNYTRNILLQILAVILILALVCIWQRDVVYQIYVANQLNAVGWVVNGSIVILFLSGLAQLVYRFYQYRSEEQAIIQLRANVGQSDDLLAGVRQDTLVGQRFLLLQQLNKKRASINQNALAATLLAAESSRNSFLKFIHNILILTGVFGTIISLSMSLLGASDILQSTPGVDNAGQTNGLGTIIFGMSTALSTTLTAIIAYLLFGYFYIKLTDTQTFIVSRVEEITTTAVMPCLNINQETVAMDYTHSIKESSELVRKLDQSQQAYADSAHSLQASTDALLSRVAADQARRDNIDQALGEMRQAIAMQREDSGRLAEHMREAVSLLERGFRLRHEDRD